MTKARVAVDGSVVNEIGRGYVVLLGVALDDADDDANYVVRKLVGLRLFPGRQEFDLDIREVEGELLLVSQFTLLGDCHKGRRPSWARAASADVAEPLYLMVVSGLRAAGIIVKEGVFAAKMVVELANDGPVTIVLDSREAK